MLVTELVILCIVFFLICYLNTGSDSRNIKSYSSYPDKVQEIIRKDAVLSDKTKQPKPLITLISNIIVFCIVLFIFGFFVRQDSFEDNFRNVLILGQVLNLFDFLVIDILWWRNSKRVRFSIAEEAALYQNPGKHILSFLKGIILFLIVAVIDGFLLMVIC